MKKIVMFSQAIDIAVETLKPFGAVFGRDIILIRDLLGRIRIVLRGEEDAYCSAEPKKMADALSEALGAYAYSPENQVIFSADLMEADRLFDSDERQLLHEEDACRLWLIDRQLMGLDWSRAPFESTSPTRRVTFFGIKGGVGRSTALVVWAWKLAKTGKNVLVMDLDLESPGISSTLLPQPFLPDYGIVDWFVEDAVGQGEAVTRAMIANSPLARDLAGRIRVVPAYGRESGDYLPKLARAYMEHTGADPTIWGLRLLRLVERMESLEQPDVVFLDSRAGLHDIAAVTVTRMGADVFLFAVDSAQTWTAYGFLFRHWWQHFQGAAFRSHLQMVASMVPETGRDEYLNRFREHSWDLFREHLYDEAAPNDTDAFSFDVADEEAPALSPAGILAPRSSEI